MKNFPERRTMRSKSGRFFFAGKNLTGMGDGIRTGDPNGRDRPFTRRVEIAAIVSPAMIGLSPAVKPVDVSGEFLSALRCIFYFAPLSPQKCESILAICNL